MIDQNSQFFAILTNVGVAKQAKADALGTSWKITQMGVGDANGTDPQPSATQTALINERRRAPLNQLKVDPTNAAIIIAEQVIPEDVGGWWIREIGLYDSDNDLVAVANCAPSFKPLLAQGSGRTQVVRMNMIVSNSSNVELKIDPSVVLATRAYVDAKVLEEIYKLDSKQSVRVATTANIALTGLQTVDGIVLVAGDRVLVKNQTAAKDNGLYVAAVGAWSRTLDADNNFDVTPSLIVSVEQGTAQADTRWQLVTDGAIVLGTTALTFQNITQGLAALASPTFTGDPKAPTASAGDNDTSLATTAFVQYAVNGAANIALNATGDTALTAIQAGAGILIFTGTLTGNVTVTLPAQTGRWLVFNQTNGAFSLTLKNASGATCVLTQGRAAEIYASNGGGVIFAHTELSNLLLSGVPTASTAALGTNSSQLATTAFVQAALAALVASSPAALDTLNELAAALGNDPNFAATMTNALAAKAPLASPVLTGNPTGPTRPADDDSLSIATTQWVQAELRQHGFSGSTGTLISPGVNLNTLQTPGIFGQSTTLNATFALNYPVEMAGTLLVERAGANIARQTYKQYNNTKVYVRSAYNNVWTAWDEIPICNSPAFTGSPTAPTAAQGSNTTQIATTAFVQQEILADLATVAPLMDGAAAVGTGTKLSREDHRHPVDTSRAPLASPALTGTPTAPTAAVGTNTQQIANTAFVQAAVAALVASSPAALDTLAELAAALGNDANFAATMTNQLALKAPLASPIFTGDPKAPTPTAGDNDTSIATTEFVQAAMNGSVSVNIAGTGSISLTAAQAGTATINLTGALTGNRTVVVPNTVGRYQITNNTTGAFTVTVKTAAGTGPNIAQGASTLMYCDGTNVLLQQTMATQLQAEVGTENTLPMTPLRVFQAIAKVVGQATEAVFGWAKVATQAQTNAGADDTTIVTPKKLRFGFAVSLNAQGYVVFPTWLSGLIIQWTSSASIPPGATGAAYWPTAFPNGCIWAMATPLANSGNANAGNIVAGDVSTIAVNLYNWGSAISAPSRVIAIGV